MVFMIRTLKSIYDYLANNDKKLTMSFEYKKRYYFFCIQIDFIAKFLMVKKSQNCYWHLLINIQCKNSFSFRCKMNKIMQKEKITVMTLILDVHNVQYMQFSIFINISWLVTGIRIIL